jgi:hypothetical protein
MPTKALKMNFIFLLDLLMEGSGSVKNHDGSGSGRLKKTGKVIKARHFLLRTAEKKKRNCRLETLLGGPDHQKL